MQNKMKCPGLVNVLIAAWFFANGFYWLFGHHDHARDADYVRAISTFVFCFAFARAAVLEWRVARSKEHQSKGKETSRG